MQNTQVSPRLTPNVLGSKLPNTKGQTGFFSVRVHLFSIYYYTSQAEFEVAEIVSTSSFVAVFTTSSSSLSHLSLYLHLHLQLHFFIWIIIEAL